MAHDKKKKRHQNKNDDMVLKHQGCSGASKFDTQQAAIRKANEKARSK